MTNQVKIGVIGLGAIGERLIQGFTNHHPQTKVVAVCDNLAERAQEMAKKLGDINWYSNHQDLLSNEELDFVYVAVPPKFHHGIVLDVIEKGMNVLCEKPLANSIEEAEEMMTKANEAGIIHAMNFPLNYSSAANTFAKLVKEKYIGDLRRLELKMHFPQWPRAWQQNPWIASREQGGFVLEVGVHYIQQTQRIFGNVTYVNGKLEFPDDPEKSEIGILANLELEDGTPFVIDGLSDIAGEERISYTAYGTEGTLSLVNWAILEGGKIGEPIKQIEADETLSSTILTNLVNAFEGKPSELYDFTAGYEAQVILEKLRNQ